VPPAIAVEGVTRSFGDTEVIHETTLAIRPREIFGLIGPSGCGKTTLMKMLVGLAAPTSGTILVNGREPVKFRARDRARIGYVPQQFILYPSLTVEQNARFVAGLYGVGMFRRRRRIRAALQAVGLWDSRRKLARNISGGMQRRLMLATALIHRPSTLFIDEPTAGLDPALRAAVWEHLQGLRDAGATIAVTTQNLEDAGKCDRVALLKGGSVAALGTPEELKRMAVGGEAIDIEADVLERAHLEDLRFLPGVRGVVPRGWGAQRQRPCS
jgi:ABC-2 type transport system ATP-binding protein